MGISRIGLQTMGNALANAYVTAEQQKSQLMYNQLLANAKNVIENPQATKAEMDAAIDKVRVAKGLDAFIGKSPQDIISGAKQAYDATQDPNVQAAEHRKAELARALAGVKNVDLTGYGADDTLRTEPAQPAIGQPQAQPALQGPQAQPTMGQPQAQPTISFEDIDKVSGGQLSAAANKIAQAEALRRSGSAVSQAMLLPELQAKALQMGIRPDVIQQNAPLTVAVIKAMAEDASRRKQQDMISTFQEQMAAAQGNPRMQQQAIMNLLSGTGDVGTLAKYSIESGQRTPLKIDTGGKVGYTTFQPSTGEFGEKPYLETRTLSPSETVAAQQKQQEIGLKQAKENREILDLAFKMKKGDNFYDAKSGRLTIVYPDGRVDTKQVHEAADKDALKGLSDEASKVAESLRFYGAQLASLNNASPDDSAEKQQLRATISELGNRQKEIMGQMKNVNERATPESLNSGMKAYYETLNPAEQKDFLKLNNEYRDWAFMIGLAKINGHSPEKIKAELDRRGAPPEVYEWIPK